jgi:hypothetical protein
MKPELILHVGLHKTGTSAIQASLQHNEDTLLDRGFWLPPRLGRVDGGFQNLANLIRNVSTQAFLDQVTRDRAADRVIVSAENLSHILLRNDPSILSDLGRVFDVKVIIFLRRQDFLLESAFSQMVKFGPKANIETFDSYPFDFSELMKVIWDGVGVENTTVVIYRDDARFDSWAAFCAYLGVGDLPVSRSNDNRSLHRRKTLFLSRFRCENRSLGRHVFQAVSDSDAIADDGIRPLASPQRRRRIVEEHAAANALICERHGLDTVYMTTPPGPEDWRAPAPISEIEWSRSLTHIFDRLGTLAFRQPPDSGSSD